MEYAEVDHIAKNDRLAHVNVYMPDSQGYPGFINNYAMMPVQPAQYDLHDKTTPDWPIRHPKDDMKVDQMTNYHVEDEDRKIKGKHADATVGVGSILFVAFVALLVGASVN